MDEVGGVLERREQAIGHLVVHGVHPLEHEHPPAGLERGARGGAHHRAVDVLHAHHVRARGAHPGEIGMGAVLNAQPHGVGVAGPLGQQLGGEGARDGALAGAGRPVEEVRVRGARLQRGGQHDPRLRVVLGPGQGSPHAGAPLRAAPTAARTSAWTCSGERVASMRRQRAGSAATRRS